MGVVGVVLCGVGIFERVVCIVDYYYFVLLLLFWWNLVLYCGVEVVDDVLFGFGSVNIEMF